MLPPPFAVLFRVSFRAGFSDRRASSSSGAAARSSLAFNPFFVRLDFIIIIDSVFRKLPRVALTSKRDRLEGCERISSFLFLFFLSRKIVFLNLLRNLESYIYHVCASLLRYVAFLSVQTEDLKIQERKREIEKHLEIKELKKSQNRGSESRSSFL